MPYHTFSLEEVAEYLHVKPADVEELIRRQEIPFHKQGSRMVFRKAEIDAWMSQRILGLRADHLTDYHKKTSAKAHDLSKTHAIIPELMQPDYILPALLSKTRASVIEHMLQLGESTGLVLDMPSLKQSLEDREKLCSTALAGGIALLHPTHHEPYMFEDSFIALGRTIQPIPFGSPDGATTDLFFLVCCQDDRIHLHVLARVCMLCHYTTLILDLREAADAEAMYDAIVAAEKEVIGQL